MNEIIIGTKLDNKQLDKDLIKLEKELNRFVSKEEKLLSQKQKLDIDISKGYNNLQTLDDKLNIINQKIKNMEEANLPQNLATNIDYQKLISQRDQLNRKAEEYLQKIDIEKGKITDVNNELSNNRREQARLNEEIGKMVDKLNSPNLSLNKIDKGLEKTVKKVAKWSLAIFGVRSAYMAVRSAISTLSKYDDEMTNNLEYIKFVIADSIKPVIETIIKLVAKLLQYINYIANAWFGINLFKSAKEFKNISDSAKKTAKSTKDMSQNLIGGIDEITNIDTGEDSAGVGGGGTPLPGFDLSQIEGEVPGWLKWIVENRDLIIATLGGIAGGLLAIKLGAEGIMATGIGIAIAGIIYTIQSIVEFAKDPSLENLAKILEGVAAALIGVAIAMAAVNLANPTVWILLLIALVALLAAQIVRHWDEIKAVLSKVGDWIYEHIIAPIGEFFSNLCQGIKDNFNYAIQWIKDKFNSMVTFFSNLISKIVGLFKKIGTKVGDVIGGAFKAVINSVLKTIENILNFPIKSINKLIKTINKVPGINLKTLDTFKLPRLAKGGIVNNPGKGINMGDYVAGERGPEAILPLKNSRFVSDFAGEVANKLDDGVNTQLLLELNRNITELAGRPIILNINGKSFAQATYTDYKNEQKRQNDNTQIIRS